MKAITLCLGLDVHKDSITIALAQDCRQSEIRLKGTMTNDLRAGNVLLERLGASETAMQRVREPVQTQAVPDGHEVETRPSCCDARVGSRHFRRKTRAPSLETNV